MDLRECLSKQILVGDGATGTLLYSFGIDSCFEELNLSNSSQIEHIHREYIDAGADMIQTNTFGANYHKLKRYGLEKNVERKRGFHMNAPGYGFSSFKRSLQDLAPWNYHPGC